MPSNIMFTESEEIRKVSEEIIDQYHPHLADVKEYIDYYFREGGQVAWSVKADKNQVIMSTVTNGKMITVYVVRGKWETWSPKRRKTELDRALCRITRTSAGKITDENGKVREAWEDPTDPSNWKYRKPEVEEFISIVERYGLYSDNLERFGEVVRNAPHQMTLMDQAREDAVDITEGAE